MLALMSWDFDILVDLNRILRFTLA